ncbi:hypothetical protein L0128_23135 [candidate division KSB1 bacterium]|nr:hypothetical protein [candidate division KSB1 bacterium]
MNRPPYPEGTILSVSKTVLANARQQVTALSEFGVNPEFLATFQKDIETAEALPSNLQNRIELKTLTRQKDDILKDAFEWGKNLYLRIQLAYGRDSAEAKLFPIDELQAAIKSEIALMGIMPVLIELAGKYQTKLVEVGQTAAVRAQGQALSEELRNIDAAQELKKDKKLQSTQERYQLFIKLYQTTNQINRVGRQVFKHDPVNLIRFRSSWPAKKNTPAAKDEPTCE